ncbi:hypothetical protein A4D02_25145 [Niastella koreensis]|uniref:Uncharacterized protein n=1 Tax=Niastella koreensis TaxID=354356 RepID=A0ABX3P188_9BACT|nr:hypothetical protein A4D02_25145 [Niastella koreensis]
MVIFHKTVYDLASSRKELFLCPQPLKGSNEKLKMKNEKLEISTLCQQSPTTAKQFLQTIPYLIFLIFFLLTSIVRLTCQNRQLSP